MPFPCHVVPLRVYNVSFPFDLHGAAVSDWHLPCHVLTMPFFSRPQHSMAIERRPCYAVALRRTAWSEHGMASVNQTQPHCVNQMGKIHSKPLAARHAMCESALTVLSFLSSTGTSHWFWYLMQFCFHTQLLSSWFVALKSTFKYKRVLWNMQEVFKNYEKIQTRSMLQSFRSLK